MSTLKVGEIKHENFTGTTQLKLDNSGNIGLGTSTPTSPDGSNADNSLNGPTLTIYGDSPAINLTSSTTGASDYSLINFGRTGSTSNPYRAVIGYKQSDDILRINAQNHIAFDAGGGINASEIMRIDGSGKVGIGTTSPDTILEVTDGGTEPRLVRIHNSSTNGSAIQFTNTDTGNSTNQGYFVGLGASGEANVWHQSNFNLLFGTNNIERMRIDSSGRLLLGTTTEGQANADNLTIDGGDAETGITIRSGTSRGNHIYFSDGTSGDDEYRGIISYQHSSNKMQFFTDATERMTIDSAGKVGIGTNSPTEILHVKEGTNKNLHFTGGIGQIGNVTGFFAVNDANDTIVDLGMMGDTLRFATGSAASGAERMRINSNGDIMAGRTSVFSGARLSLEKSGTCLGIKQAGNADHNSIEMTHLYATSSSYQGFQISFRDASGNQRGSITNNTSTTSYNTSSDYRLKENEVLISDGITRLKTLKPYKFNWKSDTSTIVDGFFAHEVSDAVPEAVIGEKDATVGEDGKGYQQIDHSKLVPLLTAALQEAILKIEVLETKVAALETA